jgi:hypothetical protein
MTDEHLAGANMNFPFVGERVQLSVNHLRQNVRQWDMTNLFQLVHTRQALADFVVFAVDGDFDFFFVLMRPFIRPFVRLWRVYNFGHNFLFLSFPLATLPAFS